MVIPAILAHTAPEFAEKLERVRAFAPMVHIDVMDGVFVPNTTWADPAQVAGMLGEMKFEVHLMVSEPHEAIRTWLGHGATRVIFHAEAVNDEAAVCSMFEPECDRLMIAANPESTLPRLFPAFGAFHQFMIMGVHPGFGGQPFNDAVLEKVTKLREALPDAIISVDGGVKVENASTILSAGANVLVVGSAIMEAENPQEAYNAFLK